MSQYFGSLGRQSTWHIGTRNDVIQHIQELFTDINHSQDPTVTSLIA